MLATKVCFFTSVQIKPGAIWSGTGSNGRWSRAAPIRQVKRSKAESLCVAAIKV